MKTILHPLDRWRRLPRWGKIATLTLCAVGVLSALFYFKWRHYEVVTDGQQKLVPQKTVRKVIWETSSKVNASDRVHPLTYGAVRDPSAVDGKRLFWAANTGGTNADIVEMREVKGEWTMPAPVTEMNSGFDEWGPAISPDGTTIVFYSDRPGGKGGWDLWITRKGEDGKWRAPVNLPASVNTEADERFPTIDPAGRSLIFVSNRNSEMGDDLYRVDIGPDLFQPSPVEVQVLAAVNTPYHERHPALSPFGESLFFSSDRPGGIGGFDIYRSRFFDGEWLASENVGDRVNGEYDETKPSLTESGYLLRFSTDRNSTRRGESDVYQSASREIYEVERTFGWEDLLALLSRLPWEFFALLASCIVSTILLWLMMRWFAPRLDRSSILQKCFAASLVVHVLLWFLFLEWMVEKHMDEGRKGEAGLLFAAPSGPVSSGDAPPWEKTGNVSLAEQSADLRTAQSAVTATETREIRQEQLTTVKSEQVAIAAPSSERAGESKSRPNPMNEREVELPSVVLRPVQRGASGGKSTPMDLPGAREAGVGKEGVAEAANARSAEGLRKLGEWSPLSAQGASGEPGGGGMPSGAVARQQGGMTGPDVGKQSFVGAPDLTVGPVGGIPTRAAAAAGSSEIGPRSRGDLQSKREGGDVAGTAASNEFVGRLGKLGNVNQPGIATEHSLPGGSIFGERALPGNEAGIKLPARYALRGNPGKNLQEGLKREGIGEEAARKRAEQIDEMVESALRWMAQHQEADGRWSMTKFAEHCAGDPKCGNVALPKVAQDTAQTGLSLMCFLAKGYTQIDKSPYQGNVGRAIDFLLKTESNGDLRGGGNMYAQGIATMALGEAYAMTADERLRPALERAVRFIIDGQNKDGGWRYAPNFATSDTSILGWQIMALKSAEAGGIKFPGDVYDKARKWLEKVSGGKEKGLVGYTDPQTNHFAMTAEGMLSKLLLGSALDGKDIAEGSAFMMTALPRWESPEETKPMRGRTERKPSIHTATFNAYFWYYATQTLFNLGGENSAAWNKALFDTLKAHQRTEGCAAGSWDPDDCLGTQHGTGRFFMTAMCTLSLEIYYRYLPLYLQKK